MKVHQLFTVSVLSLAASVVMAGTPGDNAPLTRAQVSQSVIAARAAGQLTPAGEGERAFEPTKSTSTLTRSEMKREVIEARADGELRPAGEGADETYLAKTATVSDLTRADVKAATLQARKAGELVPAGEGPGEPAPHIAQAATPKFLSNAYASVVGAFKSH